MRVDVAYNFSLELSNNGPPFFLYQKRNTPKLFFIFQGKSTRYFKPFPTNTHFFRRRYFIIRPGPFIFHMFHSPQTIVVNRRDQWKLQQDKAFSRFSHCKKLCWHIARTRLIFLLCERDGQKNCLIDYCWTLFLDFYLTRNYLAFWIYGLPTDVTLVSFFFRRKYIVGRKRDMETNNETFSSTNFFSSGLN